MHGIKKKEKIRYVTERKLLIHKRNIFIKDKYTENLRFSANLDSFSHKTNHMKV